jgi:hypothetical protein
MTFRHIGALASEVVRNAKVAAAAIEAQRELDGDASGVMHTSPTQHFMCGVEIGGAPLWEEGENEAPIAQTGTGPASNGMGKEAGAVEAPASSDREELHQTAGKNETAVDAYGTHRRPALRLVMGSRGMRSAIARPRGAPTPALRSPMLIVVAGTHASRPSG